MTILALLLFLAIVYGYWWLVRRIRASVPKVSVTVPKSND